MKILMLILTLVVGYLTTCFFFTFPFVFYTLGDWTIYAVIPGFIFLFLTIWVSDFLV